MTFEWTIFSLEVNKGIDLLEEVVVKVYWQYTLSDSVYRVFETGNTLLLPPQPESFISLKDVSKDTVVTWLLASEDMEALDNRLYAKLESAKQQQTYIVPFIGNVS